MAFVDPRSGELTLRIVYDGSPEAGKTTSVRSLTSAVSLRRRGASASPGTLGDRTEYFDWVDFAGGYFDGRRVRCQLVTVPGQTLLLHRRRYLLDTADAFVFVADSRPAHFEEARTSLAMTLGLLTRDTAALPVGLVLQANKQDLPGATTPEAVARGLGVDARVPVVGTNAATGEGLMQAFVIAVGLATERVRATLQRDSLRAYSPLAESPEGLHAAMLAALGDRVSSPASPCDVPRVESDTSSDLPDHPPPIEGSPSEPPELLYVARGPGTPTPSDMPRVLQFPDANAIASGNIWPAVRGRAVYAATTRGTGVIFGPRKRRPWAPRGAIEWTSSTGALIHAAPDWCFTSELEARAQLVALARDASHAARIVPEQRTFVVIPDAFGFRVIMITPPLESIRATIAYAIGLGTLASLEAAVERIAAAADTSGSARLLTTPVRGGALGIAFDDRRLVRLGLDADEERAGEAVSPLEDLVALVARTIHEDSPLRRWFEHTGVTRLDRSRTTDTEAEA